jgi:hypothetical protein
MGAMNSALASCRASRGDLRGSLCGSVVDKFGGALCVSRGSEHCSIVSSQYFHPGCDIGCVIFARFQSKIQIGTKERSPEFGNQFLDRVTFAPEAMPAEVTAEPGLAACPVGAFMRKGRIVTVGVLETLEWRHLDHIGANAVKRTISAVSDGCAQGCEELFRVLDAGHRVECRCGLRVINFRQAFDLLDVENGVPLKEWDFPVDFVTRLFVGFLSLGKRRIDISNITTRFKSSPVLSRSFAATASRIPTFAASSFSSGSPLPSLAGNGSSFHARRKRFIVPSFTSSPV